MKRFMQLLIACVVLCVLVAPASAGLFGGGGGLLSKLKGGGGGGGEGGGCENGQCQGQADSGPYFHAERSRELTFSKNGAPQGQQQQRQADPEPAPVPGWMYVVTAVSLGTLGLLWLGGLGGATYLVARSNDEEK